MAVFRTAARELARRLLIPLGVVLAVAVAALAALSLYILSTIRERVTLEIVSPDAAFSATLVYKNVFMDYDVAVRVADNGVPTRRWGPWELERDRTKTVLQMGEEGGLVALHWQDDRTLVIEYPSSYDFGRPPDRMIISKDDAPWHGVNFVMRPIPLYAVVIFNRRPEPLRRSRSVPYYSIDACGEGRFTWNPPKPEEWRYEDQQGNVVFSGALYGEIVDGVMVVRDEGGAVLVSTPLKVPLRPKDVDEIRLVIAAEPGTGCP